MGLRFGEQGTSCLACGPKCAWRGHGVYAGLLIRPGDTPATDDTPRLCCLCFSDASTGFSSGQNRREKQNYPTISKRNGWRNANACCVHQMSKTRKNEVLVTHGRKMGRKIRFWGCYDVSLRYLDVSIHVISIGRWAGSTVKGKSCNGPALLLTTSWQKKWLFYNRTWHIDCWWFREKCSKLFTCD
jgi:hypothetical protein